jgi:hypothetical protein
VDGDIRHIESGATSFPSMQDMLGETCANIGGSYVFSVSAGVNTFDIQLARTSGNGTLNGWWGEMNALYVPFGSTGSGTLGATDSGPASVSGAATKDQ